MKSVSFVLVSAGKLTLLGTRTHLQARAIVPVNKYKLLTQDKGR